MYYHLVEVVRRERSSYYKLSKTYKRYPYLKRHLEKVGTPYWILTSKKDHLDISKPLGGKVEFYHNSGGLFFGYMPVLPYWKGR